MAKVSSSLLEMILRDVSAAGEQPWYPGQYVQATGVPRDALDACLDQLRLANLVQLTEWVQDHGQGYTLTPAGAEVLNNPRLLARLRAGGEVPRATGGTRLRASDPPSLREPGTAWDRGEIIRQALLDPGRPAVTQALLFANFVVFGIGLWLAIRHDVVSKFLSFGGDAVVNRIRDETGSLKLADLTVRHQWWRLLSYCFVHGGIIHLAMNMFVLYSIGSLVEKMWGAWRYLALYLISGMVGGVTQLLVNPNVGLVGASGALCGLLTSMAVWVRMNRDYLPPRLAQDWMRNILTNVMLIAFLSFLPGVSWAGHAGGGVAGILVAVPLNFSRFGQGAQRWLGAAGVAAVPLLAFGLLYQSLLGPRATLSLADPEVRQARAEYRPVLLTVDDLATQAYEKVARPILKGMVDPKADPKEASNAVEVFKDAQEKLDRGQAILARAAVEARNPAIGMHLEKAREFVEGWAKFYKEFARALDPVQNWTPERQEELREQYRVIREELYARVRESPLFKADAED